MDKPTQAVAQFLKARTRYLTDRTEAFLKKKFDDLKAFNEANSAKHYGDLSNCYIIDRSVSSEEQRTFRILTWLLLDKERYGLLKV